jgi:Flavoprotein
MADSDQQGAADAKGDGADGRSSLRSRHPLSIRPFRVLLGITGSVAAVKGPELILQLMDELSDDNDNDDATTSSVEARVVLTRGGSNFWNCAHEYDPISWRRLQERLNASNRDNEATTGSGSVLVYGTAPSARVTTKNERGSAARAFAPFLLLKRLSLSHKTQNRTTSGGTGRGSGTRCCTLSSGTGPT